MRAFHDSRDIRYRAPYGAVAPGTPVTLAIDVADAPDAQVHLRTWVDGEGERLYPLQAEGAGESGAVRYSTALAPAEAGIVWYHFVVRTPDGAEQRYGVRDGKFGGSGTLYDWEPPSFQITVNDPDATDRIVHEIFGGTNPMRRPPAEMTVSFLRGETTAREFAEAIETLRETCPPEAFQRAFDLLGSFTQAQLFALLAGASANEAAANPPAVNYHSDPSRSGLAKGRLWCACLVQMLACHRPVAHPADRQGPAGLLLPETQVLEGHEDADCEVIVQNVLDLHRTLPLFAEGNFECFAPNDDVIGFRRWLGDESVCVLVNASLENAYDIPLPLKAEAAADVLSGYALPLADAAHVAQQGFAAPSAEHYVLPHLYQLGSAIVYFRGKQLLDQPLQPGLGVLAHITSLPTDDGNAPSETARVAQRLDAGKEGGAGEVSDCAEDGTGSPDAARTALPPEHPGTLGAPARAFVDWLAQAGVRYWQVLPVNPTDEFGSPYAGISAFAGNLELLEEGTLEELNYAGDAGYRAFCKREADWLEPYAAFMAIRQKVGAGVLWQDWPQAYRSFAPSRIAADPQLAESAERWRQAQYAFECQWRQLRAYANERGVSIVGDMPIYVSADSSDVWANPGIFQLDASGRPCVVAGCPPDDFAADGQVWGNPVYDWKALAADGFGWWLRRLRRSFELYDVVRLDHFIGFCRYFCIPAGRKATEGVYRPGPGLEFFRAAYGKFGPLPIIAEDLGAITPAVRALAAACGFPGMDIVQFVDGNDPLSGYRPRPGKVAYTGTHDNHTLLGYAAARYPHQDARETTATLMRAVAESGAAVAVVPLQDAMMLDDASRMNTPGTASGNWTWQAAQTDLDAASALLRQLVQLHATTVQR